MAGSPYQFTLSLNVLNHLGLNLYSNVPAVLAEAVANAWDADAERVDIDIDVDRDVIIITDDGHGMDREDINNKYLTVGYQRREKNGAFSPRLKRPVMGRKGIGKLSLFSIARLIIVYSVKDGAKNGFSMDVEAIKTAIKKEKEKRATYKPDPVPSEEITITKGTQLILKGLNKRLSRAEESLRRRLARRFSVIGPGYKFEIAVNKKLITVADRDYLSKVECLWTYGRNGEDYKAQCAHLRLHQKRSATLQGTNHTIDGWIGTVKEVGSLREPDESLNRIVIMVRGKVAQEDILDSLGLTGIYTKYLLGEIHADFLDTDTEDDIATSGRQKIMEDDPRYVSLKRHLESELAAIRLAWNKFRDKTGLDVAQQIPAIKEWFKALSADSRNHAERLFGKINQLPLENDAHRRVLLKHAVLAFESFKYKDNLDALEKLKPENLDALVPIFNSLDDIEATLYYQIVNERIAVIRALRDKVGKNTLEKVVQQHLFSHLWLLDPAWERATGTEYMEQAAQKEFKKINAALSSQERAGRIDIRYATGSGKHVIVELKRAGRVVSSTEIIEQVEKYRNALMKLLSAARPGDEERVEVVCVVGRELSDWGDGRRREESEEMLKAKKIRVVMYQTLIENAYKAYKDYFDRAGNAGRLVDIIRAIESDEPSDEG